MSPEENDSAQPGFSSSMGAVFATAGVAIWLGNIWRFPYMMQRDGGAAFLVLYLVLFVALGAPLLMSEWTLGRYTRRGPWGAYQRVGMPGGTFIAILMLVTVVMAASYYGVVLAWVLQEAVAFTSASISGESPTSFNELTAGLGRRIPALIATVGIGCAVLWFGVQRGIQRASQTIVPLFFVLFLIVLARVLTLDGAVGGLLTFLKPDPTKFTPNTALSAMGQVVFSLGVGGMFMVLYGSYMRSDEDIPMNALGTVLADVSAALLAGLIVIPAVLVFNLDPDEAGGPGLLFNVMPSVFAEMPAGTVFGAVFFISIFIVAMLSLIAAYETVVAALVDGLGWTRRTALALVFISQVVLAMPAYFWARYIEDSDFIWGSTMQLARRVCGSVGGAYERRCVDGAVVGAIGPGGGPIRRCHRRRTRLGVADAQRDTRHGDSRVVL